MEGDMKLKCLSRYDNVPQGLHYRPGQVLEVSEDMARWLMDDSPSSFEHVKPEPEVKEVEAPPQDKAVKRAPRSKAARSKKDEND
jgi:hypothetical protein